MMAKRDGAEEALSNLASLRERPADDHARELVRKGLASRVSFVTAKAADVARELRITGLCSELQDAFSRFIGDPKVADKGCQAKTAAARAALELDCPDDSIFRVGITHVQMEPSFGGPVDAAAELRGLCAIGLVQTRSREAMSRAADLLADSQTQARIGAVRALACAGREEGVLLLRYKALTGDREPAVIGECLTVLLALQPRESLQFVGNFLDSPLDSIREEAALALGTSKEPGALDLLRRHFERTTDRLFRRALLTAIAGLRIATAIDFLVSVIARERVATVADALEAARIYRHDPAVCARIEQAIAARDDNALKVQFSVKFGS